jgi:hypothetical protein
LDWPELNRSRLRLNRRRIKNPEKHSTAPHFSGEMIVGKVSTGSAKAKLVPERVKTMETLLISFPRHEPQKKEHQKG